MKLTSTIIAFILLTSMLIVGVFAVKQTQFSVGGNIVFNASGIDATISAGTLSTTGSWATGNGTGKMQEIEINTNKSSADLAEEYASWSDLDLAFNETGEDVTITFKITNNSTNLNDALVAYVNIDDGESSNAVASITNAGAIIDPDTDTSTNTENTETFIITFSVLDKDVNASLKNFKINFDLRYATVEAESATDTTLTYDGIIYSIEENNTISLKDAENSPTSDIVLPAYIKSNDATYTLTALQLGSFYGMDALTSVSLPKTITVIEEGGLSHFSTAPEVIIIPSSVTSIGTGAICALTTLNRVIVDKNNGVYDSRNNCNAIIETETNTLIAGCNKTKIPNDILIIGQDAFSFCEALVSIEIPNSVKEIQDNAFWGSALESITIPASVELLGAAFTYCQSLKTVTISSNDLTVNGSVFEGTETIEKIVISSNVNSISGEDLYSWSSYFLVVDSANILSSLTSTSACANLLNRTPKKIYVKTNIINNVSDYIKTNFRYVETITSGEYKGYTSYSKTSN